jgi:GT2 family glycosyltransferase
MSPAKHRPEQVGFVIVSWNTRELLARCLESLRASAEAGRAEVVVVDNASEDGSAELVRERFGWATLLARERNLGFGPAVNLGAASTSGGFVAAANADLELGPEALEALLAAARAAPEAGAFAPRLVMPDGKVQHSVHSFPSLRLAVVFNLGLASWIPGLGDRLCLEGRWDPDRDREVDWAHGALLLVRREAWDAVGGFDPAQWMYAEDIDLCWRLRRAGWRTRYVPKAIVRHEVSAATARAFGGERTARHMAAAHDWMVRRRGAPVATAYAALNAIGSALRLSVLAPLASARPARFGARRRQESIYLRLHARAALAGASGKALAPHPGDGQ